MSGSAELPFEVKIRRNPAKPLECIVAPQKFTAKKGRAVVFRNVDLPAITITFSNGSPFNLTSFGPSSQTVTNGPGTFDFKVTWPEPAGDGSGSGSGEVPPG
jgi:hypothetical protein